MGEFKVILTNKTLGARKALVFHNGRGSQEGVFAELKSDHNLGRAREVGLPATPAT